MDLFNLVFDVLDWFLNNLLNLIIIVGFIYLLYKLYMWGVYGMILDWYYSIKSKGGEKMDAENEIIEEAEEEAEEDDEDEEEEPNAIQKATSMKIETPQLDKKNLLY